MTSLVFLFAATLGVVAIYAQDTIGRSVSYSNGILAVAAITKGADTPGLADDISDKFSDSLESGALWVNNTRNGSGGWGVRFGFDDKSTKPTAVVVMGESVYVAAILDDKSPILYKYDAATRSRIFSRTFANNELGPMSLMAGRVRSGSCDELVVVLTIAAGSSLLPDTRRERPGIGLWVLDACTGNPSQEVIILEGIPDAPGVVSQEIPMDISMATGGEGAYVLLLEGRKNAVVTNSVAAIHRIDLISRANTVAFMPVTDVVNARVRAETDCVLVAVDSHPAFNGGSAQKDEVKVFRRNPETLETLEWGTEKKASSIDPSFTVTLPRRDADKFTQLIDIGFWEESKNIVLLINTFETIATWNNVKDTVPSSAPAVRSLIQPGIRQSTNGTPRSILLFVNEDASIARRIDELRNQDIAIAVLPQAPLPAVSNDKAELLPSQMAIDNDNSRAYVVGTWQDNTTKNLWSTELSIRGNGSGSSATPSPSPGSGKRVCIGTSSTTYEGRLVADLVTRHSKLRHQVHPKNWGYKAFCILSGMFWDSCTADAIPMLCYSWAPPGRELSREKQPKQRGRLCATDGHVLEYNGKLVFMRDFCNWPATNRCERVKDVPWNFKGPCGTHIVLAHDLLITQHGGDYGDKTAEAVARSECDLRSSSRLSWTLQTL